MIRGVLKTFGLLPGAGRGLRFGRRVEALLEGAPEIGLIVRPLLATWRQLREQIAVFDIYRDGVRLRRAGVHIRVRSRRRHCGGSSSCWDDRLAGRDAGLAGGGATDMRKGF